MARAKGQVGRSAPGARGRAADAAEAGSGKPRRGCCLPRLMLALLLTAMVCFVLHTLWIIDLPRVPHLRARPKRKPAAVATEAEKARTAEKAAGRPPGETAGPEPAGTGAVEPGGLTGAGAPAPAGSSASAMALKAQEDERKRAERKQQQKQAAIFAALSPQKAAEALAAMPEDQQLQILQALEEKQAARILEQMPVEKRVRVLTALGEPFAPL